MLELIPFPKLLCLCVYFAISSDSPVFVLICLVHLGFFKSAPERQKQCCQRHLTLPLCVSY